MINWTLDTIYSQVYQWWVLKNITASMPSYYWSACSLSWVVDPQQILHPNEYSHNAEMWEKSFYWQSSPILLLSMRRVLMEFLLLSSLRSNWIKANINYSGPPLLLLFSELIRLLPFHHQLLRTSPRMPLRVAAFNDIIPHSSTVEWQSLHKLRFWKHRCLEMDDSRLG